MTWPCPAPASRSPWPEPGPADDVEFLLAANRGAAPLPLAKVASGGELARAMLAARLVLTEAPPTLVFDEVDAGVGGEAALAVGRALAELAADHQVLVVTHLPQVAAFADHQVVVTKDDRAGTTVARPARSPAPIGSSSCPACSPASPGRRRPGATPRSCSPRPPRRERTG